MVQTYWIELGWNKASWDEGTEDTPDTNSKYWSELTPAQQGAATNVCYREEIWDGIPIPKWSASLSTTNTRGVTRGLRRAHSNVNNGQFPWTTVEYNGTVQHHTVEVVPINHDPRPCPPKPPGVMNRHGKAWVHIDNYTVTKFPGFGDGIHPTTDYFHEKKVSQLLSPYPNFVTLLSWNDACGLLVFERLFPSQGFPARMTPKLENWTAVEDQIHDLWEVLERHHINPSVEFLMGFNNIFIGTEGNVTMFDFNAYRYKGDGIAKPPDFSTTFRMEDKHKLLESLRIKRELKYF